MRLPCGKEPLSSHEIREWSNGKSRVARRRVNRSSSRRDKPFFEIQQPIKKGTSVFRRALFSSIPHQFFTARVFLVMMGSVESQQWHCRCVDSNWWIQTGGFKLVDSKRMDSSGWIQVVNGTGGGTRTHKTVRSADFESAAYANSATPARSSELHVSVSRICFTYLLDCHVHMVAVLSLRVIPSWRGLFLGWLERSRRSENLGPDQPFAQLIP